MAGQKHIHLLYTKIPEDLPAAIYDKHLILLPDVLKDKYFRYRRWQDRAANLFSKMLLIRGLRHFGFDHRALEDLDYTDHGRPYLKGNVDFNISHSGDYILCGVGEGLRLGVDIEQVKEVEFSEFESLMTPRQWQQIKNAGNPFKEFFRFWAIKESIIKADGRGLYVPLKEIIISDNTAYYQKKWFLKELSIDEHYCACLASNQEDPSITLELIDLNNISEATRP